ncbi:putative conjugative transposon proteinTn1549-like, CTn4-Orf5 [Clostridioides difficile]|uniref:Conjugative transposon protein Tn1549-like, CTn4-Orf5 n=1 Tax=Clostridioides difficile (strain 630) TaxID=272563 RepID=Q18AX6_CLOD6|nr:putative conjugative transposon protein Tn1549-like, CTn4-Orf5 [Clostridioides difficile 630]CEJ97682.1 putative conjugative transposon proteinTn1549-like, CTn4-Orf5 [Clostridioides difficile]
MKPCMSSSEKKGGIDAVTKKKTTCMIRAPTKIPIAHTDN